MAVEASILAGGPNKTVTDVARHTTDAKPVLSDGWPWQPLGLALTGGCLLALSLLVGVGGWL